MNQVNKTLYIPLYGKSYVSKRGLFLDDKKAEEIWSEQGFALTGKSKSKWLAYYMGIRSAVFDEWLKKQLKEKKDAVVVHIGCGLDSRAIRVGTQQHKWYDVDFPEVIEERKRYYKEDNHYKMIAEDVRNGAWLDCIEDKNCAVVLMEGVSMYLTNEEMQRLTTQLCTHFQQVALLVDCYTSFAVKMSKYKNPIHDVGVKKVYGIDTPSTFENDTFVCVKEHDMTPQKYVNQLKGLERRIFGKVYAGGFSKRLYRLYEYEKTTNKYTAP